VRDFGVCDRRVNIDDSVKCCIRIICRDKVVSLLEIL
jgi:hypothetical protein